MNHKIRIRLSHFAQGLLMGGADIIPGVSGGTMAIIVGIYERLIAALSSLFSAGLALLRLNLTDMRRHLRKIDWDLLVPLGLGIATAVVVGALLIPPLLHAYPMHCRGLFFGLIAASLAIPWRRIEQPGVLSFAVVAAAAVAAFFLVGLPDRDVSDPNTLQIFGAAAVAICAMILPGVSGAFLLLVLGLYEPTLLALNNRDVIYVLTFMAGAVAGLGTFTKFLNWLLTAYHDWTMAALVGVMLGSLRALWPWLAADRSLLLPAPDEPVLIILALAVLGFAAVAGLTWWGRRHASR
ncbi:MAG: DUF368 domain-containing protein [Rhodothermales bacterium]